MKITRFWANNIGDGVRREQNIRDYCQEDFNLALIWIANMNKIAAPGHEYGLYAEDLEKCYEQEKLFYED